MTPDAPHPYLSTAEAAESLAVSVSTIKRWVDEKVLPAHRTAGGHRKLLRAEVLALARQGDLPHADLAVLGAAITADLDTTSTEFWKALMTGTAEEVGGIVRRAY